MGLPDKLEAFRSWLMEVAVATTLVNPLRLIVGNLHKSYLADLAPDVVPTLVVPEGMTVDLGHLPWDDVVVKPAIGVGGNGVVRHATQADLDALTLAEEGAVDAVVQPYLASVERVGEVSVVASRASRPTRCASCPRRASSGSTPTGAARSSPPR